MEDTALLLTETSFGAGSARSNPNVAECGDLLSLSPSHRGDAASAAEAASPAARAASDPLHMADRPESGEVHQLRATVETLKGRLRERELQKQKLNNDLLEARRLSWEHKRAAEQARQKLREIVVQTEGEEAAPEEFASSFSELEMPPEAAEQATLQRKRSVRELLEQKEQQLTQACSALADTRAMAEQCWRAAEERLEVVRRLQARDAVQAIFAATAQHPAGEVFLGACAARLRLDSVAWPAHSPAGVLAGDGAHASATIPPAWVLAANMSRGPVTSRASLSPAHGLPPVRELPGERSPPPEPEPSGEPQEHGPPPPSEPSQAEEALVDGPPRAAASPRSETGDADLDADRDADHDADRDADRDAADEALGERVPEERLASLRQRLSAGDAGGGGTEARMAWEIASQAARLRELEERLEQVGPSGGERAEVQSARLRNII